MTPISTPISLASNIFGLTPVAIITISLSISLPSSKITLSLRISIILVFFIILIFFLAKALSKNTAISSSRFGVILFCFSTILTFIPSAIRFSSISNPINPVPAITMFLGFLCSIKPLIFLAFWTFLRKNT